MTDIHAQADMTAANSSPEPNEELVRTGKDADATRRALIRAARRRFATEGYRAATVRHIAADAGVNVALINRYFGSKEGLFEACMNITADELDPAQSQDRLPAESPGPATDIDGLIGRIIAHVADSPNADDPLQLLLLLRSSGDDNADRIRRRAVESYTEKIARVAGWDPSDPSTAHLLLRAQLALATALGTVMLRLATGVQPLAAAAASDLAKPLGGALRSLLGPC